MSKSRSRRTSPPSGAKLSTSATQHSKLIAGAEFSVFFIAAEQLENNNKNTNSSLQLEHFYHPGKGRAALFLTQENDGDQQLLEVLQYAEPRRSWLIGNRVCSNGQLYMTTPIDVTFLALHHIRRHCAEKALALDNICVDEVNDDPSEEEATELNKNANHASTRRLLSTFVAPASLRCIADVKTAAGMTFYKYSPDKALAWLALKTRHVAASLQSAGVHCGHSALSQNYARSERAPAEELTHSVDYLRMACDIVGGYLDLDLHEQLISYLQIPSELKAKAEEAAKAVKKRKSETFSAGENKKPKLNSSESQNDVEAGEGKEMIGAAGRLKNSSLLDESLEGKSSPSSPSSAAKGTPATPLQQRSLSAKEKALAKGAKGTKSISSFFKK